MRALFTLVFEDALAFSSVLRVLDAQSAGLTYRSTDSSRLVELGHSHRSGDRALRVRTLCVE